MIIRHPLTVFTLAAILMASGAALAGGMPSDEGPEVILDDLGLEESGLDELEIGRGNNLSGVDLDDISLDESTITAIIKSQIPEALQAAFVPVAYVTAVAAAEVPEAPPQGSPKLPPALTSPEGDPLLRDHR